MSRRHRAGWRRNRHYILLATAGLLLSYAVPVWLELFNLGRP